MNKFKIFFVPMLFVFMSFSTIFAQNFESDFETNFVQDVAQHNNSEDNSKASISHISSLIVSVPFALNNSQYDYVYGGQVILELGTLFNSGKKSALTFSADLGYNLSVIGDKYEPLVAVSSFVIGATPKISVGKVSVGFGGGVKLPFSAVSITGASKGDNIDLSIKKIDDDIDLTPYLKAVVDYSFFVDTKTAIIVGVNGTYNFDVGYNTLKASEPGYYLGAHIGVRFAPKL